MSFAKHFVNDPNELVLASLRGVASINPQVELDELNKIIYRKPCEDTQGNVSIISGGGAGHEPSFAGYVGEGMLTAAVSGSIFASPSPSQIFNAITKRVETKHGVLLVIMNYTGDVLNFGLAAEKARAAGIDVEMVVVGDDVGVGREKGGKVGRRGIAGTILVQKIIGAIAQRRLCGLQTCKAVGDFIAQQVVSVGASLAHVHVPGREETQDSLAKNEIEIGMGIHNEQGSKRIETPMLPGLIGHLLELLLDKDDPDRAYLDWGEDSGFVLMVNNLGGVSPLEMGAIVNETLKQLHTLYAIDPKLVFNGAFMTSLNGLGFSLSLLKLNAQESRSHDILENLQYPVRVPAWPAYVYPAQRLRPVSQQPPLHLETSLPPSGLLIDVQKFCRALKAACERLKTAEKIITYYDEQVGDGDCGISLSKGSDTILNLIGRGYIDRDVVITAVRIADAIEKSMDGTSGAIYCIFTNALANALREQVMAGKAVADIEVWSEAAKEALTTLEKYTPARPGDRTLMDALRPFVEALIQTKDIKAAAKAAREGAERTIGMVPRLGRTVYVQNVGDIPDPGAIGVAEFVEGLASAIE